jgi:hypothetical protein
MMADVHCPVCLVMTYEEPTDEHDSATGTIQAWRVTCPRCGGFRVGDGDLRGLLKVGRPGGKSLSSVVPRRPPQAILEPDELEALKYPLERMHLLSGYLRELTVAGHGGITVTAESANAMTDAAPRTVSDRTNRLLLNLAVMSGFAGQRHSIHGPNDYPLAYGTNGAELMFLLDHLMQDGLLTGPQAMSDPPIFEWVAVSLKGWTRVEQLRSRSTSFTQAFVAMTFDAGLEWIYSSAIAPAVQDAGYQPLILSRQEHADRVDERIVLELNRSRFVIAEFAQHRPSVYFEAGYAVGRGLPVIWTCRAEDYGSAHFDTRQYNHIVWRTAEELRERLHTRIKVVVG